jgi:chromate transporter
MVEPALIPTAPVEAASKASLGTLASVFLRLGATSFGGPAAHIARMEEEVVRRRGWLTRQEFMDLLGATNLIPGPNSTQMAIHIGYRLAGWLGLLVGGLCFILPAVLIVMALGCAYVNYGALPRVQGVFKGIQPVIIAIVVQALWKLGRTCIKTWSLAVLAVVAVVLVARGFHQLLVLFGSGFFLALIQGLRTRSKQPLPSILAFAAGVAPAAVAAKAPFSLWALFLFFLKIGSVLFGSGYVLLAFLRSDLVESYGWLKENELLDAIAVGQFTPGPVFTTATFIGYLLWGPIGAVVATVGIFLPAFVFVALSVPLLPWLRKSPIAAGFLDGVNAASLALMAVVAWELGRKAIVDVTTVLLALAAVFCLLRFRVNSAWLVLGGAVAGFLRYGLAE